MKSSIGTAESMNRLFFWAFTGNPKDTYQCPLCGSTDTWGTANKDAQKVIICCNWCKNIHRLERGIHEYDQDPLTYTMQASEKMVRRFEL